jgi:hypothetical protein
LEGLRIENVYIFYGYSKYFIDILVHFSVFGIMYNVKSGNPDANAIDSDRLFQSQGNDFIRNILWHRSRVTRLGEFSPNEQLFT